MIPGIAADIRQAADGAEWLEVRSETPLLTLNSSIWGGGFGLRRRIVNRQVDKSYDCSDPTREMEAFLRKVGGEPSAVSGMLTAAWVRDRGHCALSLGESGESGGLRVEAWATVGLSNAARAGLPQDEDKLYPGTINLIVAVDGVLTEAALVNAVITATEAKAAALQDLDVRLPATGRTATGTTTDAVAVAATQRGTACAYAGTGTRLGYLIGRTVYEAVAESAGRYRQALEQRKGMRA